MEFLKRFKKNFRIVHEVQKRNLTYLDEGALMDLYATVNGIEKNGIMGEIVEAGCALGGSSIVLATAKSPNRGLYIFDVFGMIPKPGDKDGEDVLNRYKIIKEGRSEGINGTEYYGYQENLLDKVKSNFKAFNLDVEKNNIQLVKGLYQDTLASINFTIAVAHIDCDWYESVNTCLIKIVPYLAKGGVLIIDDYYVWSGCKKAVDEYFYSKENEFEFVNKSRLHIIKK